MQEHFENLKEWENAVLGPRLDEIPLLCSACGHGHGDFVLACEKCGEIILESSSYAQKLMSLASRYESAGEKFSPSAIECYFGYAVTGHSLYPPEQEVPGAFRRFQRLQSSTTVSEQRHRCFGDLLLAEYLFCYYFGSTDTIPKALKERLPILATHGSNAIEVAELLASCLDASAHLESPRTKSALAFLHEQAPELAHILRSPGRVESPLPSKPGSQEQENLLTDIGTGIMSGLRRNRSSVSGKFGPLEVRERKVSLMRDISVIVPTFNEESQIGALQIVLSKQSLRPVEVIVVDAGSTDRTVHLASAAGFRTVAGGDLPAHSRNVGAAQASAEWLLFLDADVHLQPDVLHRVAREQERIRFDAASCWFAPDSKHPFVRLIHYLSAWYFLWATRAGWPHGLGGFLLVKRAVHLAIGGFDESVTVAEDQDYLTRLSRAGHDYVFLRRPDICISARRFFREGIGATSLLWAKVELRRIFFGEVRDNRYQYFRDH